MGGFLAWRATGRLARGESFFGDEAIVPGAVATIEEARFAKNELKRAIFERDDVPPWLVGVGIGGDPGSYWVTVAIAQAPATIPELRRWVPKSIQGVPVVADASGGTPLEMSTS